MSRTRYVVLCQNGAEGGWETFSPDVEAPSAKAAIREAVGVDDARQINGEYVAIPLRSFKPVKVRVKTQQRLEIG